MNLLTNKTETVITKPNFHTTLRVLHNLWSNGRLDIFELDKILRLDYGYMVQHLEPDFMHVESLDGLSTYSLGDCEKYKIN
jgi:hypothetical protein